MSELDVLLHSKQVIDGLGGPSREATVGIKDGRIVSVGEAPHTAQTIDLDGLALAPGFIDIHTHYDAQIFWDRDLTPSTWHGITSVIMGNCGFGIAPAHAEHRGLIASTLENVEGMSAAALRSGISWDFETFPEYLRAIRDTPTRANVGAFLGHTPLRLYVMGDEAYERAATNDEIEKMQKLLREGLVAGALGFSTSRADAHTGDAGRPVPSRIATESEITDLLSVLNDVDQGVFMIVSPVTREAVPDDVVRFSAHTQRPITWGALLSGAGYDPLRVLDQQDLCNREIRAQISCRPLINQFTLLDPIPALVKSPAFKEILQSPRSDRATLYADASWRNRAREETGRLLRPIWSKLTIVESEVHKDLVGGPSLSTLAEQLEMDPFDLLIDLALAEELKTRFRVVLANDDKHQLGRLLQDERTLISLSDAGAHVSQLCDAVFATYLLEHWVRETGTLTLEQAIQKITSFPANFFGLKERGAIAPGYAADLVAFDPETVAVAPERRVWDMPGGADRIVADSHGIEGVWVNGIATRFGGRDLENVRPGTLLRPARTTRNI